MLPAGQRPAGPATQATGHAAVSYPFAMSFAAPRRPAEAVGPRHRLPRRDPRRRPWPSSATRCIGLDVDEAKVARWPPARCRSSSRGCRSCCARPGLRAGCASPPSYEEVADFADVHFVCVGTPQRKDGYAADLTYVEPASSTLAPLPDRRALVVGKSTVPVGHRAADARSWLASLGAGGRRGRGRLEPGVPARGLRGRGHPAPGPAGLRRRSRRAAEEALRAAFAPVIAAGTPVVVTDFATAELVKVAANSFLATKISFINAMAEVCEVVRRGRDHAVRGARRTTPGSASGSCTPGSASAAAACPRTSARSWPGPRSSASSDALAFLRGGRRDQQAAPGPGRRPGPRAARRRLRRASGSASRRGVQAQLATTSATRRRWTWPRRRSKPARP